MRALAARIDEADVRQPAELVARRRRAAGDWPDPG
jgi:hypothetical protein